MVINFNNLGGEGGGGGASSNTQVIDGNIFIDGVPIAQDPVLTRWMVGDDPQQVNYRCFIETEQSLLNTYLRFNYRGYNIGETLQTPVYLNSLMGMLMYNSYARLINEN